MFPSFAMQVQMAGGKWCNILIRSRLSRSPAAAAAPAVVAPVAAAAAAAGVGGGRKTAI